MRPYRIGMSSDTLVVAWPSRTSTGSGRPAAGANSACPRRGDAARARFPAAARSSAERCVGAVSSVLSIWAMGRVFTEPVTSSITQIG